MLVRGPVRGYLPVLTEQRQKLCLPFYRDDSLLSTEIGELMASNQIRGSFPLDELKIPRDYVCCFCRLVDQSAFGLCMLVC